MHQWSTCVVGATYHGRGPRHRELEMEWDPDGLDIFVGSPPVPFARLTSRPHLMAKMGGSRTGALFGHVTWLAAATIYSYDADLSFDLLTDPTLYVCPYVSIVTSTRIKLGRIGHGTNNHKRRLMLLLDIQLKPAQDGARLGGLPAFSGASRVKRSLDLLLCEQADAVDPKYHDSRRSQRRES